MERLISSMQDQIKLLKKDLREVHDQISTHQAAATPTPALATTSVVTVAAVHPPPLAQPPPLAMAQPPPPSPARHFYQGYPEDGPYFQPPRRQLDRRPPRCFLCGEEGHSVSNYRPAQFSSACCVNERAVTSAARLQGISWNYLPQRMVKRTPLMYS